MKTNFSMRSIGLALALAGHAAIAADGPPVVGAMASFHPAAPPKAAIDASFLDAHDQKTTLGQFRGKLVLVNFWATWCAPCVKEMPALDQFKRAHESERFAVVTVSEDHNGRAKVDAFLGQHGLTALPGDLDPGLELANAHDVRGFPTTLLLDTQGRELGRIEGDADWTSPDAWALVEWYLDRPM